MARVTASFRAGDVPLRRLFVEHRAGPLSLGWTLTDRNGSVTFDAGPLASRVDVRLHCRNSVIRVVDDSDSIPGTSHVFFDANVGNGEVADVSSFRNHYRILTQCQDVYDTVWRQFKPYRDRGDFPLRRKADVQGTFAQSPTCEASFPDQFPGAILSFVEPAGVFTGLLPIMHVKRDDRLFGTGGSRATLIPHELGHVMHFAAAKPDVRATFEAGFLGFLVGQATTGGGVTHDFEVQTNPMVAYIEAVGFFSDRFFAFAKLRSDLQGANLRREFFRNELSGARLLPGPEAAQLDGTRVVPSTVGAVELVGPNIEGAIYGALFLDMARRVGLKAVVELVLASNATDFSSFRIYVSGRGNDNWTSAVEAVTETWRMS